MVKNPFLFFLKCFAVLALTFALGSGLRAQQAPGKDCYSFPPGGKKGTTIPVTLGGTDWTPDSKFLIHDSRIRLEVTSKPGPILLHLPPYWFDIKSFANDPRLPREVSARFVIPPDLPSGPILWSVANANGASPGGVFFVDDFNSLIEEEDRTSPQIIPAFPITIEGRLKRIEEVDYYAFKAPATGPLTIRTMARSLGNELNLVLAIKDESGKMIGESHDTEGVDPALTIRVEKDRNYTLSVRDLDYRGYRSFTYRLSLIMAPRLLGAFPPAGKTGEKKTLEWFGIGIAAGSDRLETVRQEVTFPNLSGGHSFPNRLTTPYGITNGIQLFLTEGQDPIRPPVPNGGNKAQPFEFQVPGAINSRITKKEQVDSYTFQGKKGDSWVFEVEAKKLGSPVDATLELLGPDGKSLLKKDDSQRSPDPTLPFTITSDGPHRLIVRDVSGRPPDLSFVYRLVARKPKADFSISADGVIPIALGGKADLTVTATREGTFKEPIQITIQGLPSGVTAPRELIIPAGADSIKITLECAKDAAVEAGLLEISGTATIQGKVVKKSALSTSQGTPVQKPIVAITMKPPFKVKAAEADGGRRIPRGGTHLAEILIERTDGFQGEIILDMAANQQRHRQGIRGEPVIVPPGQTKIVFPVFTPEWLETTRTSRIGLVAMAKIPDPKGTPRFVMAPMDGQITMSMEGALMKLGLARGTDGSTDWVGVPGKPLEISLRLARTPKLIGPVKVELIAPPSLSDLVRAEPLILDEKTTHCKMTLLSKPDPRLVGLWKLTARATAKRDGYPVVSETTIEVEWENAH